MVEENDKMVDSNVLKDKIETNLITRTFYVSGMPVSFWDEIDAFCKEYYGDVRWVMIKDLYERAKVDYKYETLYNELSELKERLAVLEESIINPVKGVNVSGEVKTFGQKSVKGDLNE